MKLPKYLPLTVWLLFILNPLMAQDDYVVTIKGDTVYGNATIVRAGKFDIAQLTVDSKKTAYTAMETKAVLIDHNIYHPINLGNNIHFMKLLKNGFISLYGYRIENQTTYDGRLLRKSTGTIFDVPIIKFRSSVIGFINDCDSAAQVVKSRKLKREDLEEIVNEYNRCKNEHINQGISDQQLLITKEVKKSSLSNFIQLIEESQVDRKSEVMGLLNDMMSKIEASASIPLYQKNALKDYLVGKDDLITEFEKLMKLIE